jgi:hypothetical protein
VERQKKSPFLPLGLVLHRFLITLFQTFNSNTSPCPPKETLQGQQNRPTTYCKVVGQSLLMKNFKILQITQKPYYCQNQQKQRQLLALDCTTS